MTDRLPSWTLAQSRCKRKAPLAHDCEKRQIGPREGPNAMSIPQDIQNVLTFAQEHDACSEATSWLKTQSDPRTAWDACERPDWMIWYARRRKVETKILVKIACACARTALKFVPEGENRPRIAIETAERWIVGDATIEEVRLARNAAADAYAAYAYAYAYAASAADAAYAAAYAAAAADAADAYAATYAYAYATYAYDDAAAADAAAADAAAAAHRQANVRMCEIVRAHIRYEDIALP